MRYSYSALVLATVTICQVAAGPVKHAHQHLHKKHDAEVLDVKNVEKRDWNGINFATVAITYSVGQTWGDATSAAVAAAVVATPTSSSSTTTAPATTAPAVAAAVAATSSSSTSSTSSSANAIASIASIASTGVTAATVILSTADESTLTALGAEIGQNSVSNNGQIWIGSDGEWTTDFINSSGEDIIIVCWGPTGSWVNANAPLITHSLPTSSSLTLSFGTVSGACSAVYEGTSLVNGQISETWFEFTFGSDSVFDVSREVNMSGHSISLVGDICTSDMSTCVFKCTSGNSCEFGYELDNCANGSQVGATYGLDDGAPSGGCRLTGSSIQATFS